MENTEPLEKSPLPLGGITHKCERALHFISLVALLFIAYAGQLLLIPIVIAAFIALFAAPAVNFLVRLHVSRALASLLTVALLTIFFGFLCSMLIEPSLRWLEAAPEIVNRLLQQIEKVGQQPSLANGDAVGQAMSSTLFNAASVLAQMSFLLVMQITAVVILTYFFLAYGEQLMRNFVRVQDSFSEKKINCGDL